MRVLVFFALLPFVLWAKNPTLMVFMRPETCPWCGKFEEEILSQKAFQQNVEGKIDITRSTTLEMEERYQITEVPSLILLSATGDEITRLSYLPLTPEAFADHLLKICALQVEIDQLTEKSADQLKELYNTVSLLSCEKWKAKVLECGIQKDTGIFFLLEKYAALKAVHSKKAHSIREQILQRQIRGAELQLAIIDAQERLNHNEPISSVIKPLKRYIDKFGEKEKNEVWRAHLFISQYLIRGEKWDEALKHAEMAHKMAPEAEKKQAQTTLNFLKEQR
ncbi:MAG: hypothetical protein JSR58_06270 [Verrucomicrobia bacterium]|nr:hypothetical protein [Verrucomicrobiota bacterium]